MPKVSARNVTDASCAMTQKPHCQFGPRLRYHAVIMLSRLHSRLTGCHHDETPEARAVTTAEGLAEGEESTILRTIGWLTAGLGAVAIGLFVGRELRQRYKFNRRTPYDFYSHSGDEISDVEFGVGI